MSSKERIKHLAEALENLSRFQFESVENLVEQLSKPFIRLDSLSTSDIITSCMLVNFGDALRIHHCFSYQPFTKDKFEFALEKTLNFCGIRAQLSPTGNPGSDILVEGIPISLKTQANKGLNKKLIHISKFMEMGKGEWGEMESNLEGFWQFT